MRECCDVPKVTQGMTEQQNQNWDSEPYSPSEPVSEFSVEVVVSPGSHGGTGLCPKWAQGGPETRMVLETPGARAGNLGQPSRGDTGCS